MVDSSEYPEGGLFFFLRISFQNCITIEENQKSNQMNQTTNSIKPSKSKMETTINRKIPSVDFDKLFCFKINWCAFCCAPTTM